MHSSRWGCLGFAWVAFAGCSGDTQTTASSAASAGSESGGIHVEEGEGAGEGGLRLDVGGSGVTSTSGLSTAEGGPSEGCQKVDFVFVVDSSPSMEDEQDNLIGSFPGFIEAIEQNLDINDFHLMVVDAGQREGRGCDGTLGAGQISSGEGTPCGLSGDSRFATTAQADLVETFSCMASRGVDGPGNEETVDALLASIRELSAPGGCNEGFLREDAVLVVTIITDEEDDPGDRPSGGGFGGGGGGSCGGVDDDSNSRGNPSSWRDDLSAIKGGDPNSVVVLGLIGDCDIGDCPALSISQDGLAGAEPAPRLREFITSFQHGSTGPVCADDYAPFFNAAVGVIRSACEGFVPPVG